MDPADDLSAAEKRDARRDRSRGGRQGSRSEFDETSIR
jgi:hypothetical protein